MNGVDIIVFTGGIGENDEVIRAGVTEGLSFLGAELDAEANNVRGVERVISTPTSKVKVCIIPTDEELMIASDTAALV
jgi:acetate kinase